jgi:hypothetical protein
MYNPAGIYDIKLDMGVVTFLGWELCLCAVPHSCHIVVHTNYEAQ